MRFTQEQKLKYRKEKQERIKQIRSTLSQMSDNQRQALADKYGIMNVEGHLLSPFNQCFLVAQAPINFTVVGGFRQWKKAGRIVRKGEHGFYIFIPKGAKNEEGNIEEVENFWTVTVFDVSQTDLISEVLKSENVDSYLVEVEDGI